jgi:hypothetical protein
MISKSKYADDLYTLNEKRTGLQAERCGVDLARGCT